MLKENIIKFFNKIFRLKTRFMISNINDKNYQEYKKTYDTLIKIFGNLNEINAFLIGGISAAIQTNQDLYRQNDDIDIMCKQEDLPKLIERLQKIGYVIDDRRGIKTRNRVDSNGVFQAIDHEINADNKSEKMLDVGIFTYQIKGNEVIIHSYAFEEKEGKVVGTEKDMPIELFYLMYDRRTIDYKGLKIKTQSKEYIFMTKCKGVREKDKLDASVVEPNLDGKSKDKIERIRELSTKTRPYRILYDKDGKILSRTKLPTPEEETFSYLDDLFMRDITRNLEEIVEQVLQSEEYKTIIVTHPEANILIKKWKEETQYKIDLLNNRKENYGRDNDNIQITSEVKKSPEGEGR